MATVIELLPEVEARLVEAANRRGESVQDLANHLLSQAPLDPLRMALLLAEDDDEPVTDEDLADIDTVVTQWRAGTGIPHAVIQQRIQNRG